MKESNMGEVVHPKINHRRIEFSEVDKEVDTVIQDSDDPEMIKELPSAAKKFGQHFMARFSRLRTDQEAT